MYILFVAVVVVSIGSGVPLLPGSSEEDDPKTVKSKSTRKIDLPYPDKECTKMDKSNIVLLGPTGCGEYEKRGCGVC